MDTIPTLSIVATPIGNLEDITLRAIRVLKEADVIFCEDTRVTGKLLKHYEITTPKKSYHAHSKDSVEQGIVTLLQEGKNIALVSDAGTPTISDPGSRLVHTVRATLGDSVKVQTIPGPSAFVAALSVSGFSAAPTTFLGFLPQKKGRQTLLKMISERNTDIFIMYESPHRLVKLLGELSEFIGGDRTVMVARELTKVFEESRQGTAADLMQHFLDNPSTIKGEIVVLVDKS